jgi:hypothetical protein
MTKLSDYGVATEGPLAADFATRFANAKKNALHFMFDAQRLMLGEILFTANELFDRTRTETHLLSEFVSKMAESHSVRDIRTTYRECGQHQIDFIRRDCERLFKHGERMIETTANLFQERLQN